MKIKNKIKDDPRQITHPDLISLSSGPFVVKKQEVSCLFLSGENVASGDAAEVADKLDSCELLRQ